MISMFGGRQTVKDAKQLQEESAAFLNGTLAFQRAAHGDQPQHWEWLNLLARCDERQIRLLAARPPLCTGRVTDVEWPLAMGYLAAKIRDAIAAGDVSLAEVQHIVLVPIEEAMAGDAAAGASPPETVVRAVLGGLARISRLHQ